MKHTFIGMIALVAAVFASGCVPSGHGANTISRSQAGGVQTVRNGEIMHIREVQIEGTQSGAGAVAGGALGYALGRTVGGGSGNKLARTAGAVGGAAAGGVTENRVTQQAGVELTVELETGEVIAIVQAADQQFAIGDHVRVLQRPDGSARVVQ